MLDNASAVIMPVTIKCFVLC